ncbi:hypothetical protein MIN45_P2146 [Methylomarinovum tepidoasis]|uniref:Nucleotidyltransferase n=1 Tax=Methylomarinovum tepidoasis TaxID=2840183 RepID=A0AAU9C1G0_9GAMM|nr:hypothetical protein [Methylomarinovum sp. IN45]BCX89773.1 hypothetical protein MIN45_P2146 [Methylomarinovum sp. IN45]
MHTQRNRIRVAQLSARIIIEEGVNDYAIAKRKAAERLGLDWGQNLPDDDSVTAALQDYHRIFRFRHQPQFIRHLRRIALEVMAFLEDFSPHLTGAVLAGTAGEHQPIQLQLFPETPEAVIWALEENGVPYRQEADVPVKLNGQTCQVPVLTLDWHGLAVETRLLPPKALRQTGRQAPRASIKALRRLLAETAD